MITIKKAKISDLKKVQELNLRLFKKEYEEYDGLLNLDWTFGKEGENYYMKRILEDDGCVYLAFKSDEIVGYLCGGLKKLQTYRNIFSSAELENMYVLKNFRSRGIGTELYRQFYKWCQEKGVKKIKVEASVQNKGAIDFYQKNNFLNYTLVLESDVK